MARRATRVTIGIAVATVAFLAAGSTAGAQTLVAAEDLPDGTPGAPAAATAADTTAVVDDLDTLDVDAFAVCITDPSTFHLVAGGVNADGTPRTLDTVVWLFDPAGHLVATNDDAASGGLGSELGPGVAGLEPGLHTVAVSHWGTVPIAESGAPIDDAHEGPLSWWGVGIGANHGLFRADVLGGAIGSQGCSVDETSPAVLTGNGRCQALGGKAVGAGKAPGLERAAAHRHNAAC